MLGSISNQISLYSLKQMEAPKLSFPYTLTIKATPKDIGLIAELDTSDRIQCIHRDCYFTKIDFLEHLPYGWGANEAKSILSCEENGIYFKLMPAEYHHFQELFKEREVQTEPFTLAGVKMRIRFNQSKLSQKEIEEQVRKLLLDSGLVSAVRFGNYWQ